MAPPAQPSAAEPGPPGARGEAGAVRAHPDDGHPDDDHPGAADTVEWGSDRWPAWLSAYRRTLLAWLLAAAAGVTLLASLLTDWQVIERRFQGDQFGAPELEAMILGIGQVWTWGVVWVLGALLLAVCTALALSGEGTARTSARLAGLVGAVVMAGVLLSAARNLREESIYASGSGLDTELSHGPGVWYAIATVALAAAAIMLAPVRPTARPASRSRGGWPGARRGAPAGATLGGPADLTVTAAEPLPRSSGHRDAR